MYRGAGADDGFIVTTGIQARDESGPSAEALHQMAAAGGCLQFLPSDGASPCLDGAWVSAVARCVFKLGAPAGVSPATWAAFCGKGQACGWQNLPGCASYDAATAKLVPGCLSARVQENVEYCDTFPLGDGPDALKNALCWAGAKSPAFAYNSHVTPLCSGSSKAGMSPALWGLAAAAAAAGLYLVTRRN